MVRRLALCLGLLAAVSAQVHAGELPPVSLATFILWGGAGAGASSDCDNFQTDVHTPYRTTCTGPEGSVSGYALGDGLPEVHVSWNLNGTLSYPHTGASVDYYLRVDPIDDDGLPVLDLAPIELPWWASLVALGDSGRAWSRVRVDLVDTTDFGTVTLLTRNACTRNGPGTFWPCPPGAEPLYLVDQGTANFYVLTYRTYILRINAEIFFNELAATSQTLMSATLDPLPHLNDSVPPEQLGRPPGWVLSEHYRLTFSENILGERCGIYCSGFER